MKRLLGASLLVLVLAACGSTESLAPLSTTSATADAGTTTTTTTAPPPPDAGVVKRTVMTRNPFGGAPGNHLIDGDFEMSTTYYAGGQLGFRAFSTDGSTEVGMATETGGLCRTGLRCAVVEPNTVLLVRGAAVKGKGNVASAWSKPAGGATCAKIRPILIQCDTFTVKKQLSLDGNKDGWCHYAAAVGEQDAGTCMYVENSLAPGTWALLDSFFVGPDDGTIQPLSAEAWAPEAETVMRLETMRAHIIATTPFGRGPRRERAATP